MSNPIAIKPSVAEILVRMEQEMSESKQGDLAEAKERLEDARGKTAKLRAEVKQLRDEADALAAQARNVKQPHTFFGKLFNGSRKAREAERKAHAAQMKALQAEERQVELKKEQRDEKASLEKMQNEIQRHTTAMSDLTQMLKDHTAQSLRSV